jgi:hypothetical protein
VFLSSGVCKLGANGNIYPSYMGLERIRIFEEYVSNFTNVKNKKSSLRKDEIGWFIDPSNLENFAIWVLESNNYFTSNFVVSIILKDDYVSLKYTIKHAYGLKDYDNDCNYEPCASCKSLVSDHVKAFKTKTY